MENSSSGRHHHAQPDDPSTLEGLPTRQLEAFGRKVSATAGQLIHPLGDANMGRHYQHALGELHKELRKPLVQRSVLSFVQNSPRELVRSKLSAPEIRQRALSHLSDELLNTIPEDDNVYSLFQGFKASLPEDERQSRARTRQLLKSAKLLTGGGSASDQTPALRQLKQERDHAAHRLEMMDIRKNVFASEIREIDNKLSSLNAKRRICLDGLAGLEQEELEMEHDIQAIDSQIEALQEGLDTAAANVPKTPPSQDEEARDEQSAEFLSASIYDKIPSPRAKRQKLGRRISMPILHEHLETGSNIKEVQAHDDIITAMDFDAPFGVGVTAALDDTVRVWDLNAGKCVGLLEGHLSSVRCLQVEDNILATGSMDASIRLWDLNRLNFSGGRSIPEEDEGQSDPEVTREQKMAEKPDALPRASGGVDGTHVLTLEAHVAEVTAIHFRGNTLISGSADKTLRQWDLEKCRCVQTLDVLWAAAQAAPTVNANESHFRPTGRSASASADFVGALQSFEAALACGTADGMVRLWDLRSGQVHRSLIGHTGPVTALQFDDVHLVTGSLDRSIRIWDLRTGSIYDAFAFDNPITSMMFDARRIVAAAGVAAVKVYDKADGHQWDCGATESDGSESASSDIVERVRIKDGYLMEGRRSGIIGLWSC